jgi:hypothetical protein
MFALALGHAGGNLGGTPSVARLSLHGGGVGETTQQEAASSIAEPVVVAAAPIAEPVVVATESSPVTEPEVSLEPLSVTGIAAAVQAQVQYLGYDVHSYTAVFHAQLPSILATLPQDKVTLQELDLLIDRMTMWYGPKVAFLNIRQSYDPQVCMIVDPHLPGLDSAIVLRQLCNHLQAQQDPSLFHHFGETLDDIGMTCRQGITHRLLVDYLAFF